MRAALLFLLPTIGTLSSPAAESTKGVDLQLLSAVRAIQPGKPFTVGLHIHHHDGFHTYWQNPGIVGIPTQIDWTLPPGFTAGPIRWPSPEIVDMAGHPAHGFRRDVLLMVTITPPSEISTATITLRANATWMACADSCHPGNTRLTLTLPVTKTAAPDPRQQKLFEETRRALPSPLTSWTATLLSPADTPVIRMRLTPGPNPHPEPRSLYFFSSDGQVSSDQPQKLASQNDGSHVLTLQRAEFGPSGTTHLPGVLSGETPNGQDLQPLGTINPAFPDKTIAPAP